MIRLVVRRLAGTVLVLLGLATALFIWLRQLPGGPAAAILGDRATPDSIRSIEIALGLNQPWYLQYGRFMGRLLQGDFGTSIQTQQPVIDEFFRRFPATIELSVSAMLIAIVVGIPLGYLAARYKGKALDQGSIVLSLIGVTVPVFFLGFLLKYVFAVRLGLLPDLGRLNPRLEYTSFTNFILLDSLLTGEFDVFWDGCKHLILPAVTLATIPLAIIVRITRASVLEVLAEDHVRTARAKGLLASVIRRRHVLRNAMLPVATTIGLQTGRLLSGAVLTETVFAFNGLGQFLTAAIDQRDYPVLQGFILFIAFVFVLVNLTVDISYGFLDPRVRVR